MVFLDVAEELVIGDGVVEVVNNAVVSTNTVLGVVVTAKTDRGVEDIGFEALRVVAGGVCCDICCDISRSATLQGRENTNIQVCYTTNLRFGNDSPQSAL